MPSIASVSKMKIVTKSIYDQHGNELFINAGIIGGKKPTARESGTTIEVRDLFFSTPARLKFLKTENYEALLIKKIQIAKFLMMNIMQLNYKTIQACEELYFVHKASKS